MNMLFICKEALTKPIGLMYLSSVLKKEWFGCDVIFYKDNHSLISEIGVIKPDIIGFSFTTEEYPWALRASELIKEHFSIPIIAGGCHPTLYPDVICHKGFDFVCRGEGEYPLVELMRRLGKKEDFRIIPNLWVKQDGKIYKNKISYITPDLNKLPFPDRNLYLVHSPLIFRIWSSTTIMAGRGCPHSCSFCFSSTFRKLYNQYGYIRQRTAKNVIAEMLYLKTRHNLTRLNFADECFEKHWLEKFLLQYPEESQVPFTINIRIDSLNERLIHALKKGGCIAVRCGIETYDNKIRMHMFNKPVSNRKILSVAKLLKKHNLRLFTSYIYGLDPSKEKGEIRKIIQFSKKVGADTVRLWRKKHYKLLPLSEKVKKEKKLILRNNKYFYPFEEGRNDKRQFQKFYTLNVFKKCNTYLDIIFNVDKIQLQEVITRTLQYLKKLYQNRE